MFKVGYLMPFMVLKKLPDYDSYMVILVDKGIMAQLPKIYAFKEYKINETGWAAIFDIKGSRVILSQLSPQYIRKIIEFLILPLIKEKKLKVKKVAIIRSCSFCKVAVQSYSNETGSEIALMCKPYLKNVHDYIDHRVVLVKHSYKIEEYIVNALYPATQDLVGTVRYLKGLRKIKVYVDEKYIGKFLGKRAMNVATATKLTGIDIEIISA